MATTDLINRFANMGGYGPATGGGGGGATGFMVSGGPASAGATAGLLPGVQQHYDPAYGGIPGVPNPTQTASTAIGGNLGNLQNIFGLAQGVGAASGAGAMAGLNAVNPGFSSSIGTSLGNINQLMSGYLSPGETNLIKQGMAEMGIKGGFGAMSPNTNLGYLTTLLGESQQRKMQGLSALNALMGAVPHGPAFDPSSMLVTPGQQQEASYLAQVLANAPRPRAAADANLAALRSGMGVSGGSPVGGFNLPIKGGPAFAPVDLGVGGYDAAPMPVYGGTGSVGQYPENQYYQSPQAYANWDKLASTWSMPPAPTTAAEDFYDIYGDF